MVRRAAGTSWALPKAILQVAKRSGNVYRKARPSEVDKPSGHESYAETAHSASWIIQLVVLNSRHSRCGISCSHR
jgi:hypothetical protein